MPFISKEKSMFKKFSDAVKWIGDHFKGLLFLLILLLLFMPAAEAPLKKPNLLEIRLTGPIMDADKVLKQIEEAKKDKGIKGVLFNVNSPGGAVAPSIEISYAIRELNKQKPVVAYASGIMASGGYYAAIFARKIYANPGAIVGSIGVFMESANVKELMDKIGVKPQLVKQGTYKEAGTPTREWTPQERAELERLTKDTYDLFVSDVAKARGLEAKNDKTYADAHIFSAERAKNVGLVDTVGIKSQAQAFLQKEANITKPVWKKKDKLESFIEKLTSTAMAQVQSYFYGLKASL
jgi:protease-4